MAMQESRQKLKETYYEHLVELTFFDQAKHGLLKSFIFARQDIREILLHQVALYCQLLWNWHISISSRSFMPSEWYTIHTKNGRALARCERVCVLPVRMHLCTRDALKHLCSFIQNTPRTGKYLMTYISGQLLARTGGPLNSTRALLIYVTTLNQILILHPRQNGRILDWWTKAGHLSMSLCIQSLLRHSYNNPLAKRQACTCEGILNFWCLYL